MEEFNHDNIDLFYYHSTDFDITRIYSIINNGILSSSMAKDKNLPFYHRNYINSSSGENFISISMFSRTFWHHFHLRNELYENSANKVTFILNGNIKALEKQKYKKANTYREYHVENIVHKNDILGIVIRKCDIDKNVLDIPFKLNYSNQEGVIKKCFDTINFLKEVHNYEHDITKLYIYLGKFLELKVFDKEEKEILNDISKWMQIYIYKAYREILKKDNLTFRDLLNLYVKEIPIYIMNRYDIREISEESKLLSTAKEKFKQTHSFEYPKLKKEDIVRMKKEEKFALESAKLEMELSKSDANIYLDGYEGPLTYEGYKIKEKVLKLKNEYNL